MAMDIKGYKVFIASPGGLEDERQKFFNTIQEYNHAEAVPVNIRFEPIGWEDTLPGIGRPQSLINEDIKNCDYFVLVLWDRWGTPPDKNGKGKYSSGTEEEYYVALDCIGDTKYPMRQIVTLFKSVNARQLSDPGPELQKVLDFKKKLEEEKTILFKTFEGSDDFEKILRVILARWRRDGEQGKTAKVRKPEILPPFGSPRVPVEPEQSLKAATEQTKNMVKEAQKLADEGKVTEAEELFAKAVVNSSEPYAYTAYGIFLMRVGRLGQAQVMYEKTLEIAIKMKEQERIAMSYGNLGNVYQMRVELDKAEEMYKKSLEIAESIGQLEVMANQYSNLGVIYGKRGNLGKAEEMHKRALKIDEKLGRLEGVARNYNELGVIYLTRRHWVEAEKIITKSIEISERIGLLETKASGYGNLGNIYLTRGELDRAEEMYKKSLEISEKLGLLDNIANQYGNLGVIYRMRGKSDKGEEMHKKSLEINERIGGLAGMAIQYGNLGEIYKQRGDFKSAREYWEKARDLYKKIGVSLEAKMVEGWIEGIKGK